MKVIFEPNTKETRIADLKRRKKFNLITNTLFKKAMIELEKGNRIQYTVDENFKVISYK